MPKEIASWINIIGIVSTATFALSIFFLRQSVLSIIRGGSHTFSMWCSLNERMSFINRWQLFLYAAFANMFKGKPTNSRQDGHGIYRQREDRVVEMSKRLSRASPMEYDSILAGITAISWARFCIIFASLTFLLNLIIMIMKLIII